MIRVCPRVDDDASEAKRGKMAANHRTYLKRAPTGGGERNDYDHHKWSDWLVYEQTHIGTATHRPSATTATGRLHTPSNTFDRLGGRTYYTGMSRGGDTLKLARHIQTWPGCPGIDDMTEIHLRRHEAYNCALRVCSQSH